MANIWLRSALWLGLALAASLTSIRVATSATLIEIVVGAIADRSGLPLGGSMNLAYQ